METHEPVAAFFYFNQPMLIAIKVPKQRYKQNYV